MSEIDLAVGEFGAGAAVSKAVREPRVGKKNLGFLVSSHVLSRRIE